MKKYFLIGGGVVLLILLIGAIVTVTVKRQKQLAQPTSNTSTSNNPNKQSTKGTSKLSQQWSQGKCKGSGPIQFTYSPMKLEDIGIILPYGLLADAHVTPIDHMYFSPKEFRSPRDKYPVFAIADGTIVRISHRGAFVGDHKNDRVTDEYRLDVEYNCSFYSYYDLLTSLSPELSAKTGKTNDKGHWTYNERIPIKAGQEIGRVGGQTVDWAVYNTDVKLGFISPDLYDHEVWKIHTDPKSFDYFTPELKDKLMALVARTVEPRLGKIDYDIDGKIVGNWFKEGTNGYGGASGTTAQNRYWDGHLAIVYDYIDPTQLRFSIGSFNGSAQNFGIKGNSPDPATIGKTDKPIKYELMLYDYYDKNTNQRWDPSVGPISNPGSRTVQEVKGVALVQLIENRKLKVEVFPDKTAEQVTDFTNKATIYVR